MTTPAIRETLVAEAKKAKISDDVIARTTTCALQSLLKDEKDKQKKHSKRPTVEDFVKSTNEHLQNSKDPEDIDDNATVVDMSHVTSTTNPSDQKYKKFTFLAAARNDLIAAIKTNSALLQANLDNLDEDDVMTMKRDIEGIQYRLNLVNTELKEIQQWFVEMNAQKQSFYEQLLHKSHDISGDLRDHFTKKMENIKNYVKEIQDHGGANYIKKSTA